MWLSSTAEKLFRFQKLHPQWRPIVRRYTAADIMNIPSPSFRPGPHDVCGAKFSFPVITKVHMDDFVYEIHDIGGMSGAQRKRHVHCFDQSDIFMFAASLSHYDEPLPANDNNKQTDISGAPTNRLAAALEEFKLFLQLTGTSVRAKRPIVILTKKDAFTSRLQYSSLSEQADFSDFAGSPSEAVTYFISKFKKLTKDVVLDVSDNDQCRLQFFADSTRGVLMFEVSHKDKDGNC
jgi:hypothetical protein